MIFIALFQTRSMRCLTFLGPRLLPQVKATEDGAVSTPFRSTTTPRRGSEKHRALAQKLK